MSRALREQIEVPEAKPVGGVEGSEIAVWDWRRDRLRGEPHAQKQIEVPEAKPVGGVERSDINKRREDMAQ